MCLNNICSHKIMRKKYLLKKFPQITFLHFCPSEPVEMNLPAIFKLVRDLDLSIFFFVISTFFFFPSKRRFLTSASAPASSSDVKEESLDVDVNVMELRSREVSFGSNDIGSKSSHSTVVGFVQITKKR
jgi:hypothetical protein